MAANVDKLSKLSGRVGHEINNLLQTIMGSLQLTQKLISVDRLAETRQLTAKAITSAQRVASLSQCFIRILQNLPAVAHQVELNELVAGLEELLLCALPKACKLETNLAADLWSTYCDPRRAEAAIVDLFVDLGNAVSEGGVVVIETSNTALSVTPESLGAGVSTEFVCLRIKYPDGGKRPVLGSSAEANGKHAAITRFAREYGGDFTIAHEVGSRTCISIHLPRRIGRAVESI